jgi:hypothetical protein
MDDTSIKMFIDVIGDKQVEDLTTKDVECFKRIHQERRMDSKKGIVSKHRQIHICVI